MQIVIDISEELYTTLSKVQNGSIASKWLLQAIKNGTPIPDKEQKPGNVPTVNVLDKIRAEIIEKYWDCDICKFNGRFNIRGDINDILQIIDKHTMI